MCIQAAKAEAAELKESYENQLTELRAEREKALKELQDQNEAMEVEQKRKLDEITQSFRVS